MLGGLLDIREEIKLLVEIKDVRDEVHIILSVLGIQSTLIEQMSPEVAGEAALVHSSAAENMVKSDIIDFTKLDTQAQSIQDKVTPTPLLAVYVANRDSSIH